MALLSTNPKIHVAKNGKCWELRLFAGSDWLEAHPYRKTLEQDWSKLDGVLSA